ncbi:MAG TPA: hypothetical protein VI522_01505 [Gammaproteobacteria bacterium]|nr:hypothetical protein [Gammaproteobacteria bacterium]
MSKGTILALGLGIVIGAAGMWFVDQSKQPTYEVDEVIEGYSIPAPNNQGKPAGGAPATGQMNNAPANDQMNNSGSTTQGQ